ncbi:MAG: hypothetical protein K8Q99_03050 [Acholeplasmataceae bacterium]|nr:hypothetical protein [Acholeplasmataceae bacterium]
MKFKTIQFIVILGILTCFFLPMFNVEDIKLTGIQAMTSSDILLFGNIIIVVVFVTTIGHLVLLVLDIVGFKNKEGLETITNIVVNLSLIAGLLMITFLGWYTNIISVLCVILMIGSAYVRYKFL